jgi:adenosylhomocysteinase
MNKLPPHDLKDLSLATKGRLRIEWAGNQMPVLRLLKARWQKERPLKGIRIGACLHVTAETANLMDTLKASGAQVALCASNPLSTQDDVVASLVKDYGVATFAVRGEDPKLYYRHIGLVLDTHPQVTMDDGADLVSELHKSRKDQIGQIIGSSEETTTGVIRLKAMEKQGALRIPVMAINDSDTKHLFDNRYGTGQSTIDGILRATNILLAGKCFVICGYGWCGRGIATRARGMGAEVVVCETDPVKALEAAMDGFRVMRLREAAKSGDIFVTATGDKQVITLAQISKMKNGVTLANSGHFNVEIDVAGLEKVAKGKRLIRENVVEYQLKDKKIYLLAEGRLVNLCAAEGHPPGVMDMSFANQALAAVWFVENRGKLEPKVYRLPAALDRQVARLKLKSMGIKIDKLSLEQRRYLTSWQEGT